MTEEYFVTIGPTAEDVTINERTHQGNLDAGFEQDWSNIVESRLTLLPVDDDIDKFTVSKQSTSWPITSNYQANLEPYRRRPTKDL